MGGGVLVVSFGGYQMRLAPASVSLGNKGCAWSPWDEVQVPLAEVRGPSQ